MKNSTFSLQFLLWDAGNIEKLGSIPLTVSSKSPGLGGKEESYQYNLNQLNFKTVKAWLRTQSSKAIFPQILKGVSRFCANEMVTIFVPTFVISRIEAHSVRVLSDVTSS